MSKYLVLAATFAAMLTCAPGALANGSLSAGIDDQFSLGEAADAEARTDRITDLGAQTVRVQVNWRLSVPEAKRGGCVQPAPIAGTTWSDPRNWDFARPKRIVDNARRRGLRIFLVLSSEFPCWASKDGNTTANPCTRQADPSKCVWKPHLSRYEEFLRATLAALGGPQRISFFNEPNNVNFLQADDITERALIYRDIWFTGRDMIRGGPGRPAEPALSHLAAVPLWYGELAQSDNVDTFLKEAFCFDGLATPNLSGVDTHYRRCDGADRAVDNANGAEAISLHTYLEDNSPQDNILYLQKLRQTWTTIRTKTTSPPYWVVTEAGVHHGQRYTFTNPDGTTGVDEDTKGIIRRPDPNIQAGHMNCLEHNMFRDPRVVGIVQYGYQDPPHGRGGTVFTSLRYRDGGEKPSWNAWRMPLTVYRPNGSSSTNLQVWGAYKPWAAGARPASVTLVGLGAGDAVVYQRTIPLDAVKYPNGYFFTTLADAPTTVTRYQIRANGFSSRIATANDCNQGTSIWNGGQWLA